MAKSSSRNYLVKEHLQGTRAGIKNWPGSASRYKIYGLNYLSWLQNLLESSGASANFLYERWQKNSAGQLSVEV